jgi:arginine N-succinyltransferase
MLVVRIAREEDVDQLYELIRESAYGMTTLKISKEQLLERVEMSVYAFEHSWKRPTGQPYVFVMEDMNRGKVVGTSSIYSKVGGFEPFYSYRIEKSIHESKMLGVRREIKTLHLYKEHNGPTEIGSLFLHPEYRGKGTGRLLSLSRFLFMAENPERFDHETIAEMRGRVTDDGYSSFWNAIGAHFFEIEFPQAETLTTVSKSFIAELMPVHPIYIPLLPDDAQATIGRVHEHTEPALALLTQEGFEQRALIDIFDGGPVVHCNTLQIRAVRESVALEIADIAESIDGELMLVSNCKKDFRVCLGAVHVDDGKAKINRVTALQLNLKVGQRLRFVAMRAQQATAPAKEKA